MKICIIPFAGSLICFVAILVPIQSEIEQYRHAVPGGICSRIEVVELVLVAHGNTGTAHAHILTETLLCKIAQSEPGVGGIGVDL